MNPKGFFEQVRLVAYSRRWNASTMSLTEEANRLHAAGYAVMGLGLHWNPQTQKKTMAFKKTPR